MAYLKIKEKKILFKILRDSLEITEPLRELNEESRTAALDMVADALSNQEVQPENPTYYPVLYAIQRKIQQTLYSNWEHNQTEVRGENSNNFGQENVLSVRSLKAVISEEKNLLVSFTKLSLFI